MKSVESSPLLTASQVAELLGIRPSTVYDASAKGRIPSVRLWQGSRRTLLRFRREEIEKLIRERSVPALPRT